MKNYATQLVAHYYARAVLVSPEFLPAVLCHLDNASGRPRSEEEGKQKEADDDVVEIQPGNKRACRFSHIESLVKKQKKSGDDFSMSWFSFGRPTCVDSANLCRS